MSSMFLTKFIDRIRRDEMNTKQDERMGTLPIGKLIVSMSVPAVAAQLINLLYNIIDRVYIGHIEGYGSLCRNGRSASGVD